MEGFVRNGKVPVKGKEVLAKQMQAEIRIVLAVKVFNQLSSQPPWH